MCQQRKHLGPSMVPTPQYKHRLERIGRPGRALRLGLVAREMHRLGVSESRKQREKL